MSAIGGKSDIRSTDADAMSAFEGISGRRLSVCRWYLVRWYGACPARAGARVALACAHGNVCVWFARRISSAMGVLVVDVMRVRMRMDEGLVNMLVLVMFCQVQPYANRHKPTRYNEVSCNRLAESNYRDRAPDKRRC